MENLQKQLNELSEKLNQIKEALAFLIGGEEDKGGPGSGRRSGGGKPKEDKPSRDRIDADEKAQTSLKESQDRIQDSDQVIQRGEGILDENHHELNLLKELNEQLKTSHQDLTYAVDADETDISSDDIDKRVKENTRLNNLVKEITSNVVDAIADAEK